MLAARRFGFLLGLFGFAVFLFLPLQAQSPYMEFHGVPPSGIGGTNAAFSAVRANGNAYGGAPYVGCCATFFFPSSFSPLVPYPSPGTQRREHHKHHRRGDGRGVAVEPVYIPYAVPYPVEMGDDAAEDEDEPEAAAAEPNRPARADASHSRNAGTRKDLLADERGMAEAGPGGEADPANGADENYAASAEAATPDPPAPVVAQPTTVLIFKDGHRVEVVNYAIVGDTVFDFSGERARKIPIADLDLAATQKANDAVGVEFKLPVARN